MVPSGHACAIDSISAAWRTRGQRTLTATSGDENIAPTSDTLWRSTVGRSR